MRKVGKCPDCDFANPGLEAPRRFQLVAKLPITAAPAPLVAETPRVAVEEVVPLVGKHPEQELATEVEAAFEADYFPSKAFLLHRLCVVPSGCAR